MSTDYAHVYTHVYKHAYTRHTFKSSSNKESTQKTKMT